MKVKKQKPIKGIRALHRLAKTLKLKKVMNYRKNNIFAALNLYGSHHKNNENINIHRDISKGPTVQEDGRISRYGLLGKSKKFSSDHMSEKRKEWLLKAKKKFLKY